MDFKREQKISLVLIVENMKENQLRITEKGKYNYLSNPFTCLMDADLGWVANVIYVLLIYSILITQYPSLKIIVELFKQ